MVCWFALGVAVLACCAQVLAVALITLIIERVGDKVVPFAEKILAQLPQVSDPKP